MRWAVVIAMVLVPIFSADARDRLVIGITQYPSTLHPNIESMAAKAYVHGLTHRPITRDGADWQPHCYLCVVLPSIEEGTAVVFDKPDGTRDIEITYELHPDAVWGDGVPVTTEDVLFTHEVGSHPLTGVSNAELYRRITAIEVLDAKRFVLTISKLTFDYESIDDFRLLPAHLERAIFEADRIATARSTRPTRPIRVSGSDPISWPRRRPAVISSCAATRSGGVHRRPSRISSCGRSRTVRRSRPICFRARST